jgi:hypothetical protein
MRRVAGAVLAAIVLAIIGTLALRSEPRPKIGSSRSDLRSAPSEAHTDRVPSQPGNASTLTPSKSSSAEGLGSPFADEDDYLRTLDGLNRTDKRRAFELVQRGDGWYASSGVKAEARQAMGITLLVDLGEMEEARVRTRRFIVEHPTSVYRPLVQGVTGIHPRPSGP